MDNFNNETNDDNNSTPTIIGISLSSFNQSSQVLSQMTLNTFHNHGLNIENTFSFFLNIPCMIIGLFSSDEIIMETFYI